MPSLRDDPDRSEAPQRKRGRRGVERRARPSRQRVEIEDRCEALARLAFSFGSGLLIDDLEIDRDNDIGARNLSRTVFTDGGDAEM